MAYKKKIHRLLDHFSEKVEMVLSNVQSLCLIEAEPSTSSLATKKLFIKISFQARWPGLQGGLQPKVNLPPRISDARPWRTPLVHNCRFRSDGQYQRPMMIRI